jgi:hypothetical protein
MEFLLCLIAGGLLLILTKLVNIEGYLKRIAENLEQKGDAK